LGGRRRTDGNRQAVGSDERHMATSRKEGSTIGQRIRELRRLMLERGLHAYIVPSGDEHQDEYVPECWQRRRWISGFTGSAGTVVITTEVAGLWTDGRYHLQAQEELEPELYTLFPVGLPGVRDVGDWLAETLRAGQRVGVDPRLVSIEEARGLRDKLEPKGISLCFLEENLVDLLWRDRPPLPGGRIWSLPETFSGESAASKLSRIRAEMARRGAQAHLVTTLDAVAWLFNLRGSDVPYNPVFVAYALITEEDAFLCTDRAKVPPGLLQEIRGTVTLAPYTALGDLLARCGKRGWRVWIDPRTTSQWVHDMLRGGPRPLESPSPVIALKAVKNAAERRGMRASHVRDGVALVRFLRWIQEKARTGDVTELSAARKLHELRASQVGFQGLSFETIVAYGGHGAVIHYRPSEKTDCEIRPEGLLLVDSGAHYLDGTTDVTRTVALGRPSEEQKDRFTRVLKGHIRLASTTFPKGTSGRQLEALARMDLWEIGLDYRHGTGHGVGCFLNVHEGPQGLSPKEPGVPLEPGMVLTNEPGYYQDGEYGIRIENVMAVVEDPRVETGYGPFFRFEVLTMVPIDLTLVDTACLDPGERDWLNSYHREVFARVAPHLEDLDRRWLEAATRPI